MWANGAGVSGGTWQSIVALLFASAVIMGSPGPSTISVTAVGAAYGLRHSLPYASGLILGTTAVLVAVALGVIALVIAIPHGVPVLITISTLYVLYLAWKIGTAPPLAVRREGVAAPSLRGGLLLAIANPKAWLAIAAVFAGNTVIEADHLLDAMTKIVLLTGMIVVIHLAWLVAGGMLARVLQDPVSGRVVNVALALTLVIMTALAVLE